MDLSGGAGVLAAGVMGAAGFGQPQDISFSFWAKGVDEGALLVTQFGVEESLFGLSQIEVRLVSRRDNIDLDSLIDQPASLSIHHKYVDHIRYFSGIIVEALSYISGANRAGYCQDRV